MTPPAAAVVAEPLPRRRPSTRRAPVRHPRRISGPARPVAPIPQTTLAREQAQARGLALRAFEAYQRVADSVLLDRLARGRLWIGLLAFGLIGIVAMQLMVLRLNTSIGAALERAGGLQRANAQLRIEAATGAGEGRIEPLAAATGMTFAPSGSAHFVVSSPAADVARAASVLSQPIQAHEAPSTTFEASSTGSEAAATSGEGETNGAVASGEREATGTSEAASSRETGAARSESSGAPSEGSGGEATAPAAGQPEASAAAAGGVAAGH